MRFLIYSLIFAAILSFAKGFAKPTDIEGSFSSTQFVYSMQAKNSQIEQMKSKGY